MDTEDIKMKWEGEETRSITVPDTFENCYFINNFLGSDSSKYSCPSFRNSESSPTERSSGDFLFFEVPVDPLNIRQHAQDYLCSLQRSYKCFRPVNDEVPVNWGSPEISRCYCYESPQENEKNLDENFGLGYNNVISDGDVTEINFEEDEFKGK